MNVEAKSRRINWRKFIPVSIILLIAGYTVGQPYIEQWIGIELPSIDRQNRVDGNNASQVEKPTDGATKHTNGGTDRAATNDSDSADRKSTGVGGNGSKPALTSNFKLQDLGGEKFKSPAGLIYRPGPQGQHRIDHIMQHAMDDPSRPVHGVFKKNDTNHILELIDAAYELAATGSSRVRQETNQDQPYRVTYTVDMQREIGFKGGRSGQRDRYPPLNKLRLVIDNGNQVITAYPDD